MKMESEKSLNLNESQGVIKLRELLKEEEKAEGLRCPLDDNFLLRFLRGKKGDPLAAFKTIKAYYKLRQNEPFPDFLKRLHPSEFADLFESNIYSVLKDRDELGRPIIIFRTRNWNLQEYSLDDILISLYLLLEEVTSYEETQKNGLVLIADHGGLTYTQMSAIGSQFTIKKIKTCIAFYKGAFPARFKGMHVVNPTYIFHLVYKLGTPFMGQKLRSRVHPHRGNTEAIFDYEMSREILPESFGGKIKDSDDSDTKFMKRFFEKDAHYREMALHGYPAEVQGQNQN